MKIGLRRKSTRPKCTSNKECSNISCYTLYHECGLSGCTTDKTTIHYCPEHFVVLANEVIAKAILDTIMAVEMQRNAKKAD